MYSDDCDCTDCRLIRTLQGADAHGRATVWTYRTRAMVVPEGEAEARRLLTAEALRAVPNATVTILSIRQTPTGRWSALIKRVRS